MSATGAPQRKDRFTALDTVALSRELRPLERRRLDRAFDLPSEGWSLLFRSSDEGPRELKIVPGRYAALLPASPDHPETPGPIARELRRLLSGSLLSRVVEPDGERMLQLEFRRADPPDPYLLVSELFGAGNLLVVHQGRVAVVARVRRFARRELRVGAEYVPPPVRPNPFRRTADELVESLAGSTADRVSTLAARVGFGGPIAEEILARCQVSGAEPGSAEAEAVGRATATAVARLLDEIGTSPRGFLYLSQGVPVDATPYASARWARVEGVEERCVASFSEAVERYFPPLLESIRKTVAKGSDSRSEAERQRAQQLKAIEGLEADAKLRAAQADAIFTHYSDAETALSQATGEGGPVVEVRLGELVVPLRRGRPLQDSAQWLYGESKRAQSKLAGAREALKATEGHLLEEDARVAAVVVDSPSPSNRRRRFWFEAYRWFLASEGEVVIAGRDASSNDVVVRRYLKAADRYVHADLHGAASVVVKHKESEAGEISDRTLTEAGQFAVAYSKAWRAGHASGRAFWVEAEKVSKSAASGEFVARGAWVIHGEKHFLEDIPLELGLGTTLYSGEERWSVAPPAALRARGVVRFLLVPGEERDRGEVEVELSRELGLSRDRLQSLLPAGGLKARRA